MRTSGIWLFLGIASLTISPADATTYSMVNQGGGIPLTGYIITDGAMGTLSQSDIISWMITETGTSGPGILTSIDKTNSTVSLTGGALSATSAGLVFTLSASGSSILSFTSNQSYSGHPAFKLTFCDTAAACFYTVGTLKITYDTELILSTTAGSTMQTRGTVTSPIALRVVTPLPASLPLLLSGLAGIGALSLRRRLRRGC
jgi:hypothetical protein